MTRLRALYLAATWLLGAATCLVAAGGHLRAQEATTFEAVSIRRVPPVCPFITLDVACEFTRPPESSWTFLPGGRLELTNQLAIDIVRVAYNLEGFDPEFVRGGPKWLYDTHYDIIAVTGRDGLGDEPPSEVDREVRALMRELLKNRFKLRASVKTKIIDIKLLRRTSDSLGPLLRQSEGDCFTSGDAAGPPMFTELLNCPGRLLPQSLELRSITMTDFAKVLSKRQVSDPVIDETGLTGLFDVSLESGVSVNGRLRRLGLQLESAKRSIDYVTIEAAEKPIED